MCGFINDRTGEQESAVLSYCPSGSVCAFDGKSWVITIDSTGNNIGETWHTQRCQAPCEGGTDRGTSGTCSVDTDGDGIVDSSDSDDDGDGVADTEDACPTGGTGADTDGDGCTDAEDYDDDGDGVTDLDDLCRTSRGPAANDGCPYVCGRDEAGGGQAPCKSCGDGEAPNDEGTACVVCEHGESRPRGSCEPDRCKNVSCGTNAYCSKGVCLCKRGFEDPDDDGVCTRKCPAGRHDPDADGVCTRVCGYTETDVVAKASLMRIPKEPWERGEAYLCNNSAVVAGTRTSSRNTRNVCEIDYGRVPFNWMATGHSHPYFTWDSNKTVAQNTVKCHDIALNTQKLMKDANEAGRNFSRADMENARKSGKPSYLVVPERNVVKVYRPPEGCTGTGCPWRVSNL